MKATNHTAQEDAMTAPTKHRSTRPTRCVADRIHAQASAMYVEGESQAEIAKALTAVADRAAGILAGWDADDAAKERGDAHAEWVTHMVEVERIRPETLPCIHGTAMWPDRGQVCGACEADEYAGDDCSGSAAVRESGSEDVAQHLQQSSEESVVLRRGCGGIDHVCLTDRELLDVDDG